MASNIPTRVSFLEEKLTNFICILPGLAIRDISRLLGKEALEAQLSDEHRATARAFEKMMENHTFW